MNSIFQDFLNELLDSENFKNLYLSLRNNYIYNFLWIETDKYEFEYAEIRKLIEYSSLFALSSDFFHIEVSQKINSFLLNLYPWDKNIIFWIQMIYVRVWNFPVIKQEMFENNHLSEEWEYIFDKELLSEFIIEKNSSKISIWEKESFINKFQKEVLNSLTENDILSVSAPTSFWKSFIVRTYITQIFSQSSSNSVLIIVPSKALIEDFLNDLLSIKREYWLSYNIITHFIPEESNVDNKIFILTQERLLATLRKNPSVLEKITLFYCDEAHKISYTWRWFILRRVIEEFIKHNTSCKKIFTSPIIKNPDYFLNKFFAWAELKSAFKLVEYKPVEKNIFLYTLSSSSKKFDTFTYENLKGKYKKELLVKNTNFTAIVSSKIPEYENDINLYKLDIVTQSNFEGNTVIYVSSKTKLIAYAKHMLNSIKTAKKVPSKQDLDEIKDYIEENFYNWLYLLDFLKKWIWIHAWFLPVWLRNKVVDLFKKWNLSYILCTSTLLEGVNLPIKNIVLLNTNSWAGNSKLWKTDFLNLIWRAWRYKYELSWNVILFNDTDSKDIFNDYLNIKDWELEIKDVEENILNKTPKKKELVKIFQDRKFDDIYKKNDRDSYEYIFYSLFINENEIDKLNLKDEDKTAVLEVISTFKSDTFFNKWIFDENIWISPISQKLLYDILSKLDEKDLLEFYELIKDRFKLKGEFWKVLNIIQTVFKVRRLNYWESFNSIKEFQKILNWISWKSLNEIINTEISYYKKWLLSYQNKIPVEKDLDEKALEELSYYTNVIGFSWVKYIRVFYNILSHIYTEKWIIIDDEEYEKNLDTFLFTLETWINSSLWKYLYSIGLSRSISVKVNKLLWYLIKDIEEFDIENIKRVFNRRRVKLIILKFWLSKLAYEELYNNLDL